MYKCFICIYILYLYIYIYIYILYIYIYMYEYLHVFSTRFHLVWRSNHFHSLLKTEPGDLLVDIWYV